MVRLLEQFKKLIYVTYLVHSGHLINSVCCKDFISLAASEIKLSPLTLNIQGGWDLISRTTQVVGKGGKKIFLQGVWWLFNPLQINPLSVCYCMDFPPVTEASCGVFCGDYGTAGPGNLHVLPEFAGPWLSHDFLLSPPYLASNLSLWRGRQWAFSWL